MVLSHGPIPAELPKPTPEELTEGSQAIGEAVALGSNIDLSSREDLNKLNQLLRLDNYEGHLHKIALAATYFLAVLIGIMFLTIVLQMILPDRMQYLTETQVEKLEHFLFSGVIGGLLTAFGKRTMASGKD